MGRRYEATQPAISSTYYPARHGTEIECVMSRLENNAGVDIPRTRMSFLDNPSMSWCLVSTLETKESETFWRRGKQLEIYFLVSSIDPITYY